MLLRKVILALSGAVSLFSGQQQLTVFSAPRTTIIVESTTNLQTWEVVTNLAGTGGPLELSITGGDRRYFRAAEMPSFRDVSWEETPFYSPTIGPLNDHLPQDESGVRMALVDGVLYDQPVTQSLVALTMLNAYYKSEHPAYLSRGQLHADRLLATAVESRGAWWLPYNYRKPLEYNYDHMEPPWYSGMAQGLAITTMLRMHAATGDSKYREAADKFYASFLLTADTNGSPWFRTTDEFGNLWFEEYAQNPNHGDYVFNGHIYALWGLYDYWKATQKDETLNLLGRAVNTIRNRFEDLREPGFYAVYCVRHYRQFAREYQGLHIRLLSNLYSLTGDLFFAKASDQLFGDAPEPVNGTAVFKGTHTAYRYDSMGEISEVKTNAFTDVELPVSREAVRSNVGFWLKISGTNELAGFHVREDPATAFLKGIHGSVAYSPARRVRLLHGITYPFTRFANDGEILNVRKLYMLSMRTETFDKRAWINSRQWIHLNSGDLAGYWVPVTLETEIDSVR